MGLNTSQQVRKLTPSNLHSVYMETSIQKLKGKVLETPKQHLWRVNKQANRNYKYTVENEDSGWTPYNSNLQMQGIKVVVEQPVPAAKISSGSVEDTLLLLDIVKEKQQEENKKLKEERIRQMAMEQKLKKERERGKGKGMSRML